jgi:hypothetical protein
VFAEQGPNRLKFMVKIGDVLVVLKTDSSFGTNPQEKVGDLLKVVDVNEDYFYTVTDRDTYKKPWFHSRMKGYFRLAKPMIII